MACRCAIPRFRSSRLGIKHHTGASQTTRAGIVCSYWFLVILTLNRRREPGAEIMTWRDGAKWKPYILRSAELPIRRYQSLRTPTAVEKTSITVPPSRQGVRFLLHGLCTFSAAFRLPGMANCSAHEGA
jgi:hypothetical protein